MSSNVKTIKFTAVLSLVFLIITYIVSLNTEIGFIRTDSVFISNNFFLTVFGGTFASMLVVLVCELQKYLDNKRNTENFLWFHMSAMYGHLSIMKSNMEAMLDNPQETLSGKIFNRIIMQVQHELNVLQSVDYRPLVKRNKNKAENSYKRFIDQLSWEIKKFVNNCGNYEIAYNSDQMDNLKTYGVELTVTSASHHTHIMLEILHELSLDIIKKLDQCIDEFDLGCKRYYQWDKMKIQLTMTSDDGMFNGYEKFVNEHLKSTKENKE